MIKQCLIAFLVVLCSAICKADFTEFYVQNTATNVNSGTSSSDTPHASYTSGSWTTNGLYTPPSGNPSSDGVTNGMFAAIFYDGSPTNMFVARITNVTTTTFSTSTNIFSGAIPTNRVLTASARIGGAWKGPNGAEGFPFGFVTAITTNLTANPVRVNFKGGYTNNITAAMSASNVDITFQGYTNTVADGGKCVIDGGTSGAAYILLSLSGNRVNLIDFIFQNNGASSTAAGLSISGANQYLSRVTVQNTRGSGVNTGGSGQVYEQVVVTGCNQGSAASGAGFFINGAAVNRFINCVSIYNTNGTTHGWNTATGNNRDFCLFNCISAFNSGAGVKLDTGVNDDCTISHCDFYNNTLDGILQDAGSGPNKFGVYNSNFVSNGVWGIGKTDTALCHLISINNGFRGNASGEVDTDYQTTNMIYFSSGKISYTSMPYLDAPNANFTMNTAEGKSTARGGFGTFTNTPAYLDMGATDHVDPSGSSTPFFKRIFTGF